MTEQEWLECSDPREMLAEALLGRASERKLRLFACACCRAAPRLPPGGQALRGVGVAERLADGLAPDAEVATAAADVEVMLYQADQDRATALEDYHDEAGSLCRCPSCEAEAAARWRAKNSRADGEMGYRSLQASIVAEAAGLVAEAVGHALGPASGLLDAVGAVCAAARQVAQPIEPQLGSLVRDLFGNPFRPARLAPAWVAWNGGTVPRLAQAAYDERALPEGTLDPARLAVQADALEEAGCRDADVLSHLRGPGPHVRGCWVIDLLLGKT